MPKYLVLGLVLWLAAISGWAASRTQIEPHLRAVFLVDGSLAMSSYREALAMAVADRIQSGLDGQLQPGDRFALWPFNERIQRDRYLPVTWQPRNRQLYAERLARTLRNHAFAGEVRMDNVMAELNGAFSSARAVTVLILSDGRHPLSHTSFDDLINAAFQQAQTSEQTRGRLLLTTLHLDHGKYVAWSVASVTGAPAPPTASSQLANMPASKPAPMGQATAVIHPGKLNARATLPAISNNPAVTNSTAPTAEVTMSAQPLPQSSLSGESIEPRASAADFPGLSPDQWRPPGRNTDNALSEKPTWIANPQKPEAASSPSSGFQGLVETAPAPSPPDTEPVLPALPTDLAADSHNDPSSSDGMIVAAAPQAVAQEAVPEPELTDGSPGKLAATPPPAFAVAATPSAPPESRAHSVIPNAFGPSVYLALAVVLLGLAGGIVSLRLKARPQEVSLISCSFDNTKSAVRLLAGNSEAAERDPQRSAADVKKQHRCSSSPNRVSQVARDAAGRPNESDRPQNEPSDFALPHKA